MARIARRYFWASPLIGLLAIVGGLFEGLGISFLVPFLSTLSGAGDATLPGPLRVISAAASSYTGNTKFAIITAAILCCVLLRSAIQMASNAFAAWVDSRIGHDIRCAL